MRDCNLAAGQEFHSSKLPLLLCCFRWCCFCFTYFSASSSASLLFQVALIWATILPGYWPTHPSMLKPPWSSHQSDVRGPAEGRDRWQVKKKWGNEKKERSQVRSRSQIHWWCLHSFRLCLPGSANVATWPLLHLAIPKLLIALHLELLIWVRS